MKALPPTPLAGRRTRDWCHNRRAASATRQTHRPRSRTATESGDRDHKPTHPTQPRHGTTQRNPQCNHYRRAGLRRTKFGAVLRSGADRIGAVIPLRSAQRQALHADGQRLARGRRRGLGLALDHLLDEIIGIGRGMCPALDDDPDTGAVVIETLEPSPYVTVVVVDPSALVTDVLVVPCVRSVDPVPSRSAGAS